MPQRDTDVQIEGPAVAELQKLFFDTWQRQEGATLSGRDYFPDMKEQGSTLVRVLGSTEGETNRTTFIMYVAAITFAENSLHMTNAYFAPDSQIIKALTDAAQRGVDVKIVLPGMTDRSVALYAGQYHFSDLLKSAVKFYTRRNVLLHAKTLVIDDVWPTVGSTNMEGWSFSTNDEVNAGRDIAPEEFYEMASVTRTAAEQGTIPPPRLLYTATELSDVRSSRPSPMLNGKEGAHERSRLQDHERPPLHPSSRSRHVPVRGLRGA